MYSNIGELEKALDFNDKILEIDKIDKNAYAHKGTIFMELGRYEEAMMSFKKVIFLDPENIISFFMIGNIYRAKDEMLKAASSFKTACKYLDKEADDSILDDAEGITAGNLKEMIKTILKGIENE